MEALFYLTDLLATVLLMWWAVNKAGGGSQPAIFKLFDYKETLARGRAAVPGRPDVAAATTRATGASAAWRDTGWSKSARRGARRRPPGT